MGELLDIVETRMVEATRVSGDDPQGTLREEAERGRDIMHDDKAFHSAQAEVRRVRPSRGVRPYWPEIEPITAGYRRVNVPCMIVWGARDETLALGMGYKLKCELPNARLRIVERTKHSMAVERPLLSVQFIDEFITGCLLYTSPSPRDRTRSRMPSSA